MLTNEEAMELMAEDMAFDIPIKHESKPYLMIPLSDGSTNGDMIKALFNTTIVDRDSAFIWVYSMKECCPSRFDIDWWDAPYERGKNETHN